MLRDPSAGFLQRYRWGYLGKASAVMHIRD